MRLLHSPSIWLVAAALLCAPARAADVPRIEIGAAGPLQGFPMNTSFFVTGTVGEGTTLVRPVFVRTAYRPFGTDRFGDKPSCEKIADALTPDEKDPDEVKQLFDLTLTGTRRIQDVWRVPPDRAARPTRAAIRAWDAYLGPVGKVEKKDDKYRFESLVDPQSLLVPGARVCFFMLQRKDKDVVDKEQLLAAIDELVRRECAGADLEQRCILERQDALLKSEEERALQRGGAGAAAARRASIEKTYLQLKRLAAAAATVTYAKNAWKKAFPNPVVVPGTDGTRASRTDRLAELILYLLGRQQVILAVPKDDKRRELVYYSLDGKVVYTALRVRPDWTGIELAENESAPPRPVTTSLYDLPLPVGDNLTLSLADLLQLARGQLPWGGISRYAPIDEVTKSLVALAGARGPLSSDEAAWLDRLAGRARALDRLLRKLSKDETGESLPEPLQKFWKETLNPICREDPEPTCDATRPGYDKVIALGFCDNQSRLLPNRRIDCGARGEFGRRTPFGLVADAAGEILDARKLLGGLKESLSTATTVTTVAPFSVASADTALKAADYATQYFTPALGFAFLLNDVPERITRFLALDLYLWPNPVDRPMWTQGVQDIRRLFFIEVGLGLDETDFGTAGRRRGLKGLWNRPVFFGVGIQPIPYISATLGFALTETRTTTIAQEQATVSAAPYFALTLDANIFDTIRSAFTGRTAAFLSGPSGGK